MGEVRISWEGNPYDKVATAEEHHPILSVEEALKKMPTFVSVMRTDPQRSYFASLFKRYALDFAKRMTGIGSVRHQDIDGEIMRFLNGENTEQLARKFTFLEIVRALGYTAPTQAYLPKGTTEDERERILEVLKSNHKELYWKPALGIRGQGIEVLQGEAHPKKSSLAKNDYIVQEGLAVAEDYRYWRIEPQDESAPIVRHCYRSIRTAVVGDGTSTVRELIRRSNTPVVAKTIIKTRNLERLDTIPAHGERVELVKIAHDVRGAYFQDPDPKRLDYLDRFMAQFTQDLAQTIGHALPILCFDIGILDSTIFEGVYNQEPMKKNVVFFECQMPFDPGVDGPPSKLSRVRGYMMKHRYHI